MLETFSFAELTVRWDATPDRELLTFTGRSQSRNPAALLGPMFSQVLESARSRAALVELRFGELEYLNSSTISALIQFINRARDSSVRLIIHYDASQQWQSLSFDALQRAVSAFGATGVSFVSRATAAGDR